MNWRLVVEAAKMAGKPRRVLERLGVAPEDRNDLGRAVREARELLSQSSIYDWTRGDLHRVSAALVAQAVCETLVSRGWTRDHWSRIHGGTSFYLFSPDRTRRVRISDHELPDNPQRECDGVSSGYVVSGGDDVQELTSIIEAD